MFYHRYLSMFVLEQYDAVIRDTQHNLDVLDLCARYGKTDYDRMCLEQIVEEPACLTHYSIRELIALAGAQGVELLMWLAMRGAVGDCVARVHSHYQVPISNTAAGLLVIEPERPGEWPSFELAQGAVAHADRL